MWYPRSQSSQNRSWSSFSDVPQTVQHLHSIHCHGYFLTEMIIFSVNCKQLGWPKSQQSIFIIDINNIFLHFMLSINYPSTNAYLSDRILRTKPTLLAFLSFCWKMRLLSKNRSTQVTQRFLCHVQFSFCFCRLLHDVLLPLLFPYALYNQDVLWIYRQPYLLLDS